MAIELKIGDKAPDFTAQDQNGNKISLAYYKGKKVILYFYPKDNTPGCTAQACNLKDNYSSFLKKGIQVIGVSIDSVASHKKFETKYDLPFPLVSDENKTIVHEYGVWGPKKFMGREFDGTHRTTFLIDEKGKIEQIIEKPNTKEHSAQIAALSKEENLGF